MSALNARAIKRLLGISVNTTGSELSILDGVTATAAEINLLDGATTGGIALTGALSVARTATADGTGTGTIAAAGNLQFVTVTSDDANKIVVLPTPTPGTIVILRNGGTGYELRSSAPATVAINGGTGASAESAIAANTMVIAVCTTATTWQAIGLVGTTLAAVEAAA